ncbi:MAG: MFS transporter [Pyrinomonadaceae bacterium]|nr:MFS transporter [Pyrinomonadaceae bacterium]
MSIVVIVKKHGKAVIAADTLYSFGATKVSPTYLDKPNKIHQFKNSYIGVVGAAAHEPVFEHLIANYGDKFSFNSKSEIFDSYLKMHPILRDEYFINDTEEGDDNDYKTSQINGLIANEYGIFGMYSWREVYEFDKFWALGSGMDFALGAMFANYDSIDDALAIAEIAVKAACEFDDGCGLPMTSHIIELSEIEYQAVPSQRKNRKGIKRN